MITNLLFFSDPNKKIEVFEKASTMSVRLNPENSHAMIEIVFLFEVPFPLRRMRASKTDSYFCFREENT